MNSVLSSFSVRRFILIHFHISAMQFSRLQIHEDWLDGEDRLEGEIWLGVHQCSSDSKFQKSLTDVTQWGGEQYEEDWPKY